MKCVGFVPSPTAQGIRLNTGDAPTIQRTKSASSTQLPGFVGREVYHNFACYAPEQDTWG